MRRTEHLGGRLLTAVGLVAATVYLVWRVTFSISGAPLWLSLPVLAVEFVGFAGAALLVWALWPGVHRPQAASADCEPADVVVRVDDQPEHELRATLLALRSVRGVAGLTIVDLSARPCVAGLATEYGAVYAATDTDDHNGLAVMAAAVSTERFLLLDAGDIPTRDIVGRLSAHLDDPRVAVVQGMGTSMAVDSAEHGPDHHHELGFERSALNPALGRRGAAVWTGSGSLVRTNVLRTVVHPAGAALKTHWRAGAVLLANGWRIVAPTGAVLAHRVVNSEHAVYLDRAQRARAAREMVFGTTGVLRSHGMEPGQRLGLLAWSVRPLSAHRRAAFVVLLCAALLAGKAPFHGSGLALVLMWLPSAVYLSLGLALLSGWSLRPGDRARWSLHSLGPVWSGLFGSRRARPADAGLYGHGLAIAVVGLSVILLLRGISDRVTHTFGELPQAALMSMLLVSLWTLALSLDVLRVLARRNQQRRTARVVSALSAVLDDRGVSIVDLTPLGAGLTNHHRAEVGARMTLDSAIPTATGVTTISVPCVVRNMSPSSDGGWRIGVEFVDIDPSAADALTEFCMVEPMWERLGVAPGSHDDDARHVIYVDEATDAPLSSGRLALRIVALLALVGAVASSASTAEASPSIGHRIAGVVVVGQAVEPTTDPVTTDPVTTDTATGDTATTDTATTDTATTDTTVQVAVDLGLGDVVVAAVCSLDAGDDGTFGTADDTYGEPVATVTDDTGAYRLDLVGEACWATMALPEGYTGSDRADVADSAPDVTAALLPLDVSAAHSTRRTTVVAAASGDQPGAFNPATVTAEVADRVATVIADAPGTVSLPAPAASDVAGRGTTHSTLSLIVLMIAGLLAASIVAGSARLRTAAGR